MPAWYTIHRLPAPLPTNTAQCLTFSSTIRGRWRGGGLLCQGPGTWAQEGSTLSTGGGGNTNCKNVFPPAKPWIMSARLWIVCHCQDCHAIEVNSERGHLHTLLHGIERTGEGWRRTIIHQHSRILPGDSQYYLYFFKRTFKNVFLIFYFFLIFYLQNRKLAFL